MGEWINYISDTDSVEMPQFLTATGFKLLMQDAGDSPIESAPYSGDFFISNIRIEGSKDPFLHNATMDTDYFATSNGPSYKGLAGPVDIDLVAYTITTTLTTSAGYNDLLLGNKFGVFPNDACGSINNDNILGNDNDNTLYGDDGDDTINGGKGNDIIYGGNGNDVITGGEGNDVIYGDPGIDNISGGSGDDTIYGG